MSDLEGYIRVMAIDPGSKTLGIAILDYNPETGHLILVEAWTLTTNRAVLCDPARAERFGALFVRIEAIVDHLIHAMRLYRPDEFIAETSYLGRLPQAFSVLTQVMSAIRRALRFFRPSAVLTGIDPASAKVELGVPGNSPDKELVRRAVMRLTNLDNQSGKPLSLLTEHSIDAVAVGHYHCATVHGFKATFK